MLELSESDVRVVANSRYWTGTWKVWAVWFLGCVFLGMWLDGFSWYLGFIPRVGLVALLVWWLCGTIKAEAVLVAEWRKGL